MSENPMTTTDILTGYAALLLFLFGGTALVAVCMYGAAEVFGAIARDYEEWIGRD